MTGKPRSIVSTAHPEVLGDAMKSVTPLVTAIETKAGDLRDKVVTLDWKGEAYDGAVTRAEWEKTQMTRVADAVENLSTAFASGLSVKWSGSL